MIRSFRHKGLKRLYEEDDRRGVSAQHVEKIQDILARLDASATVSDMDLPGFRRHPLKGDLKGFGPLAFEPTGASFSNLETATPLTSITSITTEERLPCL